ncbi:MAG: methyltransferase domain-containing protein, partial [Bacteroidales bacterium]|nr:methyltransferase domain-containing protein [Bacteroidales bacterium]
YISRHTNLLQSDDKILHIAPEQSIRRVLKKQTNLKYTTADLKSPIADIHFDVMDIPLEDNSFDVIFCNHVLEHVDNDITAMKELHRILKPGGWAVMQVPLNWDLETTFEDFSITSPAEREKVFGQYDHVRWHGRDYPQRIESVGFKVEEFKVLDFYSIKEMEYYRIDINEKMFVAFKN